MEINTFEDNGRKLLVEFTCFRCETKVVRSLEECMGELKYFNHLYDLNPPEDWEDGGFYYPTFCPQCAKDYKNFMNGAKLQETVGDTDAFIEGTELALDYGLPVPEEDLEKYKELVGGNNDFMDGSNNR